MALGLAALRLQQVVAHVGAGDVDVAADPLQQAGAARKSSRSASLEVWIWRSAWTPSTPAKAIRTEQAAEARQQDDAACQRSFRHHALIMRYIESGGMVPARELLIHGSASP